MTEDKGEKISIDYYKCSVTLRLSPKMEYPEEQYYKLNHILLSLIGFWPYENFYIRQIKVAFSLLIYITFIGAQLMKLYTSEYNPNLLLKVLCLVLLIMIWATKYVAFYAIVKNLREFRKHVRNNWSILTDDQEIDIMHKYASLGRLFTVIIALCVYVGCIIFILMQYMPSLLDIILPLNESRPRSLLLIAEYFIDEQKYFHIVAIHVNIGILVSVTTGVATESFSLTNAVHAFGLFEIASYRMERMLNDNNLQICVEKKCIILQHKIVAAVNMHRRAMEFSELLVASFGVSYLIVFTIALCSASVNLYHLFWMITMKQEILETLKFAVFTFFHFLFIIAGNFAGQQFINCGSHIHQALCSTQWYDAPLKIQKLIFFLLQKNTKTYRVDAGGLFSPSLEGLAAVRNHGINENIFVSWHSVAHSCFYLRENKMDQIFRFLNFANKYSIKIIRNMLTLIGLWPNKSKFRYIKRIFCTLLLAFSICAQWKRIIIDTSNMESLLEVLSFAIPCLVFSLKYATFCIKAKDLTKLLEQIKYNLDTIKCEAELKILHRSAIMGTALIIFAAGMYLNAIMFLIIQILPKLLDIFAPLNESRPCNLLGVATYLFDQEKYFVPIYIHMTVALFLETTIIWATESLSAIYAVHIVGLFQITSFRIQHIFDCELYISVSERNKKYYTNIINVIFMHNKAYEYFEMFNSSFEISFFLLLILGVLSLSINLFRLNQAMLKKDVEELIMVGIFVIVHFFYMFLNNAIAQYTTNISDQVFYTTCQLPWHSVPVHLQKLLYFIMQRSMKSSKFTLCGMFEGSLECFASLNSHDVISARLKERTVTLHVSNRNEKTSKMCEGDFAIALASIEPIFSNIRSFIGIIMDDKTSVDRKELFKKILIQTHCDICIKMACVVNRYYAINRILLSCVGLWPYQKSSFRYVLVTFITVILYSSVTFQLTTFITTDYDVDLLLKVLAFSIPWMSYALKYNVLCKNIKKMRDLMERVRCDWNELNNTQEIEIIKKYSAIGRFITLISTSFIYLSIFSFIFVYLLSNFLLNNVTAVNESHSRLPVSLEYFVDEQKYFLPLLLHIFLCVLCGLSTMIATETIYMSYTQHACGLFQIVSYRIEQALHEGVTRVAVSTTERNSIVHQGLINAINIHRKAIEFIEMSKANFTLAYFLVLPMGVLTQSINLYRLSRLIMTEDYHEIISTFLLVLGHVWYMFFCNYLGQEVIDHSSDIFQRIYNVQWYMAPLKVQKLLLLMMQRSMRHCTIVIGGLFIPSLEGFATLSSMSLSYFMVIYSLR
ncbi:uncharacterized protein [Linepithema humile]|uniref:uncharacterized protein n=1 Tax=Linepithema humile TaxID=83485 RepID=UPI00351F27F0